VPFHGALQLAPTDVLCGKQPNSGGYLESGGMTVRYVPYLRHDYEMLAKSCYAAVCYSNYKRISRETDLSKLLSFWNEVEGCSGSIWQEMLATTRDTKLTDPDMCEKLTKLMLKVAHRPRDIPKPLQP